jgi:enamine deaminase RidA (YjgF/YER057c/UK114 family)
MAGGPAYCAGPLCGLVEVCSLYLPEVDIEIEAIAVKG